jgi:hypothetical protein
MAQAKKVEYTDDGIIFIDPKTNKTDGKEVYLESVSIEEAIKDTKLEVKQRGNHTRAALSLVIQVLKSPRMDGFKGSCRLDQGLPKEAKSAMRQAEDEVIEQFFLSTLPKSMHVDGGMTETEVRKRVAASQKEWQQYIGGLREPGIYATVRGQALKYFCYLGKLPCKEGDESKLLSVPAMQKLIANAAAETIPPAPAKTWGMRVDELRLAFVEKVGDLSASDIQAVLSQLGQFAQDAKEALNEKNKTATELASQGVIVGKVKGSDTTEGVKPAVEEKAAA